MFCHSFRFWRSQNIIEHLFNKLQNYVVIWGNMATSILRRVSDIAIRVTWSETDHGVSNVSLLVLCSRLSHLWLWNASKLLTVRCLFTLSSNTIAEFIFFYFWSFQVGLSRLWLTGDVALYFILSVLYQQFPAKSSIQKWQISLLHSHESECNWKERAEGKQFILAAGLLISRNITFTGFCP